MTLLIAVDSGGTKTALLVRDARGRDVLERTFPGAYLPQVGASGVEEVLTLIRRALEPHLRAHAERYAAFGLPGYGENPAWTHTYGTLLQRLFPDLPHRAYNDVRLALEGALAGQPGLVALSGTGSMVLGKARGGHLDRVGGWGPLFGDEGSAYAIGAGGLRAAALALDGRAASTVLVQAAAGHYGVVSLAEVTAHLTASPDTRAQVASFARTVDRCAAGGDSAARRVLGDAARELTRQVQTLRGRLGHALPVAWAGSTFSSAIFRDAFLRELQQEGPVELHPARFPPVMGGLLLAGELAGSAVE